MISPKWILRFIIILLFSKYCCKFYYYGGCKFQQMEEQINKNTN
jgi:hypothetical protein